MPILSVGEKTKIISCHSFLVIFNVIVTWHEFTTMFSSAISKDPNIVFLKDLYHYSKKTLSIGIF